ncbi:MAG: cytochrome C oxidase Cbb3 [Myxococcaceae bacterium]|nr:MAG: cytochrome C oxidase Cbb3 [Myxococcaceae bacterium]
MRLLSVVAAALLVAACADTERRAPLAERGAELARDPAASRSRYNVFACTTCHAERPADVGNRLLPGATLEGAARRPSYWNGETAHLREAVERCWVFFMRGTPTDLDGPTGEALAAWIDALAPEGSTTGTQAVTHTWPRSVRTLPDGDAALARPVWDRACAACHGAIGTGAGRLGPLLSVLPNATEQEHCAREFPPTYPDATTYMRTVVVEKVRHGSFLGYAGTMPPFSVEALSDDDLRHLTALFRCP